MVKKNLFFFYLLISCSFLTFAEDKIAIDFENVDVKKVIDFISEVTNKNFIYDESLKGTVTVVSPARIPVERAYQTLISILQFKGYTIIEGEDFVEIFPSTEGVRKPIKTYIGKNFPTDIFPQEIITVYIPVEYVSSSEIAKVVSKMALRGTVIENVHKANAVIVTDTCVNIVRMMKIINQIDNPLVKGEVLIKKLYNLSAAQALKKVSEMFKEEMNRKDINALKISSLDKDNTLLIQGGKKIVKDVLMFLASIDRPMSLETGRIHICEVENVTTQEIITSLNSIFDEETKKSIKIVENSGANAIIINSSFGEYQYIKEIIKKLDKPKRQVFVQAMVAEVTEGFMERMGIDWASIDKPGKNVRGFAKSGYDTMSSGTSTITGVVEEKFLEGLVAGLTKGTVLLGGTEYPLIPFLIYALKEEDGFRILSTPTLLVRDGEEAKIFIGQNIPVLATSTYMGTGSSTERRDTYEY